MIPANVVRYLGLERIEKLVSSAKQKLEELDAAGRIGGKQEEDDLPFAPEELMAKDTTSLPVEGPPMMNEGGLVTGWDSVLGQNQGAVDPITGLPLWLNQIGKPAQAPEPVKPAPTSAPNIFQGAGSQNPFNSDSDDKPQRELTGTQRRVEDWSPEDFSTYTNQRNSTGSRVGQAVLGLMPMGGLASTVMSGAMQRTDRRATEALQSMVESGKDLQGNPLSTAQLDTLRENLNKITSEPLRTGKTGGVARQILEGTGLVQPRQAGERNLVQRAIDFITGKPTAPTTTLQTARTTSLVQPRTSGSSSPSKAGTSAAGASLSKSSSSDRDDRPSGGSKTRSSSTPGTSKSTSSTSKSSSSSSKSASSSSGGQKGSPRGGR